MDEEQLKKEYAEAGVDLPELKEEPQEPPTPPKDSDEGETPKEEEPLQTEPKEPRKRSIYDEYKDRKSELKTEKELREHAERERDELRQKLDALGQATTPQEHQDAKDDLEAFAHEINADPQTIKKLRDLVLKDVKPDESLQKDLAEFKAWKSQNQQLIEKQRFDEEFENITPTLNELFPKATSDELKAIKTELDKVSHTKEYHDKDLDYIAFKHKDVLSALVSPKKRGMETKGRNDVQEDSFEFDPNADYSKMSPKEREMWEKQWKELSKTEGLLIDGQGRKIML